MSGPWKPRIAHIDLTEVRGGYVYFSRDSWWAHPDTQLNSPYSWGPYQTKEAAVIALLDGPYSQQDPS